MSKFQDLTGKIFGKLKVMSRAEDYIKPNGHKIVQWNCICECGNKTTVRAEFLRSGHTKSCGCNKTYSRTKTHGKANTRLYKIWIGIKERCYNPKQINYNLYGGRGIKMCEEWLNFETFYRWAINNGYSNKLTIDRIDNNLNYMPSNCRWATNVQQANNRRSNRIIEHNGEFHTLQEWSKITGVSSDTIRMRIDEYGWDTEKSLF
jgi:hypothetical protein|uniref:Homing endonuclease n=1 Tax=Siphoviridae sp. ctrCN24 TaxID=2827953 RepID=A0A8S5SKE4_9CAUD|nr:MAG TPA: homing endonuclease [Siphoviridae sp. ctrCN24]